MFFETKTPIFGNVSFIVMLRSACEKIACKLFYEEFALPDKLIYFERVMDSCETEEQLNATKKWAEGVLSGILGLVRRITEKKYELSEQIWINGKFFRNEQAVGRSIRDYYNSKLRLLHETEKIRKRELENANVQQVSEPDERDGGIQEGA